jgi:outer membrane immunogenic protein
MRNRLIGTIASLALTGTAAGAADLYRNPASYAPSATPYTSYSWMGPYVGANFGYQWGSLSNSSASPNGIAGGLQGGFNWQYQQLVLGGETDLQLSDATGTFANYQFANPWFGTVRGRAGFAMNNILFYGTLGLAYGRGRVNIGSVSETNMHFGWTTGLGLEVGLSQNWSAKVEYLYIDLGSESYGLTGTTNGLTSNMLRFGANYHF